MIEGLNSAQAQERLKIHGYNELPSAKPKNVWRIALEVMKEPMFTLLISCGVLYMTIGDYREGSILLSAIMVIIFITFYQYRKTENALTALRNLSSPRALVIRDGKETRIPGREVVPDDIIILNEGDRITADGKIIDALNLSVDKSLLTGEAIPVTKNAADDVSDTGRLIFSGTMIVQGKGLAKVLFTGINTQFGRIGSSLHTIEQDETRLQKEMKVLIMTLFIIGAIICVGIIAAFYFTRGNFIQSVLNGLAAAMAILPEEFPVVLTIFLALGAWRLSKKNVLTRKPSAIETLGSATVLCSDKTGTITQNKMEIAAIYDGNEIFLNSTFPEKQGMIDGLVIAAHRASQINSIDPMEKAIMKTYMDLPMTGKAAYTLIKEYPLSSELPAMTRVTESAPENLISVSAKGAPEAIFSLCKMSSLESEKHLRAVLKMAESGYRVIAVADAAYNDNLLPEKQHEFDFKFLGLIGFEDPIRPEVPQAIKECNDAGIKVIMITGDFPATAKSIALQIGLDPSKEMITGSDLKIMSDEELKTRITSVNIFARVVPEQKLRIVQALKENNEIVAMTGDGVNDAPALKAAHIGIAMGNKGTDVAREASSLVLLDDNFASIVSAIRSGRRIYDNLQKAMSYIMAIHIPIIWLTLIPAFFPTLPILLMPLHIIFMELIIDPVCSIAFESEQEEKGIMSRLPRNPDERFFSIGKIAFSIAQGTMLLAMVIIVYYLSVTEGHTDGEVRAIAFSSLIVGNIFLIITNLSKTRNFISILTEKNIAAITIPAIAIIMLVLILNVSALQRVFSFEDPGLKHFGSSVAGASVILLILEIVKYLNVHKKLKSISENRIVK